MNDELIQRVEEVLEKELWRPKKNGVYEEEIYADYRDEMQPKTAIEILQSDNPMEVFCETMWEWYGETEWQYRSDLKKKVIESISQNDGEIDEMEIEDLLLDLVCYEYPYDHFLDQTFHVNIMVDTGDGNYDYVLNSVYPSYCGRYDDRIDNKASIVWLAKQQGYTKTQLWKSLRAGDMSNPNGFLESMRVEAANIASHMNVLTFLVEMSFRDLLELNRLIKLQDREGHNFDNTKNPYCGYIIIDKGTDAGLYDPWSGGGSVLEIQLEKDVKLPIRFIRSALPDGGDGKYSIESVYGMMGSAWQRGEVKKIHAPKGLVY